MAGKSPFALPIGKKAARAILDIQFADSDRARMHDLAQRNGEGNLSSAERGELVTLLRSLPAHIGFILIEHDLDIALRVVDRVTVLHNSRVLKHGSPAEIENDAEVQAIYMGDRAR